MLRSIFGLGSEVVKAYREATSDESAVLRVMMILEGGWAKQELALKVAGEISDPRIREAVIRKIPMGDAKDLSLQWDDLQAIRWKIELLYGLLKDGWVAKEDTLALVNYLGRRAAQVLADPLEAKIDYMITDEVKFKGRWVVVRAQQLSDVLVAASRELAAAIQGVCPKEERSAEARSLYAEVLECHAPIPMGHLAVLEPPGQLFDRLVAFSKRVKTFLSDSETTRGELRKEIQWAARASTDRARELFRFGYLGKAETIELLRQYTSLSLERESELAWAREDLAKFDTHVKTCEGELEKIEKSRKQKSASQILSLNELTRLYRVGATDVQRALHELGVVEREVGLREDNDEIQALRGAMPNLREKLDFLLESGLVSMYYFA